MSEKLTEEEVQALNSARQECNVERDILERISLDLDTSIRNMSVSEAYYHLKKIAASVRGELDEYLDLGVEPKLYPEILEMSESELANLDAQITLILFELSY